MQVFKRMRRFCFNRCIKSLIFHTGKNMKKNGSWLGFFRRILNMGTTELTKMELIKGDIHEVSANTLYKNQESLKIFALDPF